jgi:hypothetical protein
MRAIGASCITLSYVWCAVIRHCSRSVRGKRAVIYQRLSQMVENKRAPLGCNRTRLHHLTVGGSNG